MSFSYRNGVLCAEQVPLDSIAERFGTPCYVYSRAAIEAAYDQYARVLQRPASSRPALVCYSVKANSTLAILALLAQRGAGFDIVSGGELLRVIAAGGDPRKTVFSGIGKSAAEIELALEKRILCINVESEAELERVDAIAQARGARAPVAFRVNPDIDARTHPYISTGLRDNKFGVAYDDAERLYKRAAGMKGIELVGVGCHIGSQLTSASPFVEAAARIVALADRLAGAGIELRHLDFGGGIGIRYQNEAAEPVATFLDGMLGLVAGRKEGVIVDPGRSIVGNAGVILTRVEYVKEGSARNFVVVDAAMNDLLRPALYGAWHEVKPVREAESRGAVAVYDVVGPICESADFLAKERRLAPRQGDVLALMSAGAYASAMSSNYNTRPRAAEVLVEGAHARVVRRRETVEELFALERFSA